MDKPIFTKEQITLINAKKHKKIFTLKGPEVFAIHSLGQMQNKVVEYIDIANNERRIGLFNIVHINEDYDVKFSPDIADWKNMEIKSISVKFIRPNEYGYNEDEFPGLEYIAEISLLEK